MSVPCQTNLSVSQNFIKDPHLVASLLDVCSIGAGDVVYEIGPGRGIITAQLARRCRRVVAVEKDAALAAALQETFAFQTNLAIHAGDFLAHPLPRGPYKVFSNIPFNITSAIVSRLTTAPNPPEDICLVMQKEAAEMYLGRPHETLRSILLQPWFRLELLHRFRRSDFTPQPGVDAVLLRMRKRGPPLVESSERQIFRDFVVYGYTGWQPTLADTLKTVFSYGQLKYIKRVCGIDLQTTPTLLKLEQWLSLFNAFRKVGSHQALRVIAGSEKRLARRQQALKKVHRTRKR